MSRNYRRGVSRVTTVAAIVVLVVIVLGVYTATQMVTKSTTTTSSVVMSSSTGSSTSSKAAPTQFKVDEPDFPDTFDPGAAISGEGEEVNSNVNLPLVFCTSDPGCTTYYPVLATSWDMSPDGLTYTFQLRSDVYFSNGDPWNAYVVWWNVYRNMFMNQPIDGPLFIAFNTTGVSVGDVNALNNAQNDPGSNSTLLSIMQNPHNSVTVISPTEVQFHLTIPFQGFMKFMPAGPPWTDTDPYLVGQHGGVTAGQPNSWMSTNGDSVGDGPYIVQTYVPNQYALLTANPNYWAQNITDNFMLHPARITNIVINYKTDELTRALDVESGKAQAAVLTFNDIPNVLAANSSLYIPNFGPGGTIEWMFLDTLKPPLDNILVRRAIIAAINVTEIRASVYKGYSVPVVGPALNGMFGYNDSIKPPEYNLAEAKALLQQAGYPNGVGLPPLRMLYPTSAYYTQLAQIVVADLSPIGITVKAQQMAVSPYISIVEACCGNSTAFPDIGVAGWSFTPDFSSYTFLVDAKMGAWFNFDNATVNALIEKSNGEQDPTARAREISLITEMVQQQAGYVWLSQDMDLPTTGNGIGPTVFSSSVTGAEMFSNANYWVFVGLQFSSLYYKGSAASSSSVSSNYALNTYLLSTASTPSHSLSSRWAILHKCLR